MHADIKFDFSRAEGFLGADELRAMATAADEANAALESGSGAGSEFLGWVGLPEAVTTAQLDAIVAAARELRSLAEVVVVIGIGGSYLGARAAIDALSAPFEYLAGNGPAVIFAGNNISEGYMRGLLDATDGRSLAAIMVSKSGTTTEPAIAFGIIRGEIERRYGAAGAYERIIVVTDPSVEALMELADRHGYRTFAIPSDVGGRYSVLTPAGLLPMAVAGVDIYGMVRGAAAMARATGSDVPFARNIAAQYAAVRNVLYRSGFKIEIMAVYEPCLESFTDWLVQLFAESEGKGGRGIFPVGAVFTRDLHSLGQYIQDGERTVFETVIVAAQSSASVQSPDSVTQSSGTQPLVAQSSGAVEVVASGDGDAADLEGLAGRRLSDINRMVEAAVASAHTEGGVPNMMIEFPRPDAESLGALFYFFERACGISGYLLGVNPFDQPGVESYKKNFYRMLK